MKQDTETKLHDGSFRVTKLVRHDGESFELSKPIEYSAKCVRLANAKKNDDWRETADHWNITIGGEVFDYYTGIGHRKGGKPFRPSLSSVLYSLVLDSSACDQSFDSWCSDFDYDTDSRKALETYLACQESVNKLRRVGICIPENLREFFRDY
jgi:hypothetical protein